MAFVLSVVFVRHTCFHTMEKDINDRVLVTIGFYDQSDAID